MKFRLYSGPKETVIFNVLSSSPYKRVMKNNIDLETSFNSNKDSVKKTLNEAERAFFPFASVVSDDKEFRKKVCTIVFYHNFLVT